MKKAALHNLGCKVNAYETEAMQQMLETAGYEIVPFTETADVYIINTCSVTNIADRKSRQMLHRAKNHNPEAVVVAAGCYVQAASEKLRGDPAIDLIIGNNRKKELIGALEKIFAMREQRKIHETKAGAKREFAADVIDIAFAHEYEALSIDKTENHTRAFLKVQDGCNQFCSYCIIPYTRGRVRSRRPEDVAGEVRKLVANGCQEIVLTGIHLSSYGLDFFEEMIGLLDLIQRLHCIEGLKRIRLGSLEPRIITEEFVKVLSGMEKICPHFHLSLQSGCDETLKRMNRHYTTNEYLSRCDMLRAYFNYPAITTDVIVGFPAETEEEFDTTKAFLEQMHFYEMHIFKYSRRAGTRAAQMSGQVSEKVKAARSNALLKMGDKMSKEYRALFLERPVEVLMEERITVDGVDYMAGYTKEYVRAALPYHPRWNRQIVSGRAANMLNDEILLLV